MNTEIQKPDNSDNKNKKCCSSSSGSLTEIDFKLHWNNAFDKSTLNKLGWYEDYPEPSLRLIKKCNLQKEAAILNVGAGATTLVDELLERGYENIIANDLSSIALDKLKTRLGKEKIKVNWIVDDLTKPCVLNNVGKIDLWHDRAVLHFFNKKEDQDCYFELLKKLVKSKAFVIIAVFNLNGATKCSGLPVRRYDENMLQAKLGKDFELLETFDHLYKMPAGDTRNYIYTLFRRK